MYASSSALLGASDLGEGYRLEFYNINERVVGRLYLARSKLGEYTFKQLPIDQWTYEKLPDVAKRHINPFLAGHGVSLDRKRIARAFKQNHIEPISKKAHSILSSDAASDPLGDNCSLEGASSSLTHPMSYNDPAQSIKIYRSFIDDCLPQAVLQASPLHLAVLNNALELLQKLCSLEEIKAEFSQEFPLQDLSSEIDLSEEFSDEEEKHARMHEKRTQKIAQKRDKKAKKRLKSLVNHEIGENQLLRPLHIAVMTNNIKAARILLGTGLCKLNDLFSRFCPETTFCHHAAALGNREMIQLLLDSGAKPDQIDYSGATYQDLLKMCHPEFNDRPKSFYYQAPSGILKGDEAKFREMTGAVLLVEELVVTFNEWFENWKSDFKVNDPCAHYKYEFSQELKRRYLEFRQSPPSNEKFYLAFDEKVGHYLVAKETIPAFTIIGEYLGEINNAKDMSQKIENRKLLEKEKNLMPEEEQKHFIFLDNPRIAYGLVNIDTETYNCIDAYEYRGLMAMIASSFPNVAFISTPFIKGSIRHVFITVEEVPEGGVLAIDYGKGHSVKKRPYCELRSVQLEQFFRNQNPVDLTQMLAPVWVQPYPGFEETLRKCADKDSIEYLLATPSALLSLILDEIISVDTVKLLFQRNTIVFYQTPVDMPSVFFKAICNLMDKLSMSTDEALNQSIKEELKKDIGAKSTLELYKKLIALSQLRRIR
ncbi:MAG: ankyrin repeat domain-containing protein [Chlamydiales bacterium]